MKIRVLLFLVLACAPMVARATFTMDFQGGALFGDNTASPLADGRLVIAVTTSNASFSGPTDGSFVSGGDTLLGSWNIDSEFAGPGTFNGVLSGLSIGGGIATNQKVAIYWFTDINSISETPGAGSKYGYYTDISWVIPADNSYQAYALETEAVGGPVSDSATVASLTVSAVPEPAAVAVFFGLAALGFCARRKHRSA